MFRCLFGARRGSHTAFGGIPRCEEQCVPIVHTSKLELTTPLTADSSTRVSHEFAARGKGFGSTFRNPSMEACISSHGNIPLRGMHLKYHEVLLVGVLFVLVIRGRTNSAPKRGAQGAGVRIRREERVVKRRESVKKQLSVVFPRA